MEIIKAYVKPELLAVAIMLYFLGKAIKKSQTIKDKYIPLILGLIGIIISAIYVIATSEFVGYQSVMMAIFTSIVQGILVSGLSVYCDQLLKQAQKEE